MDKQLIITHPGSAHFDEVTAVSLLLAVHNDIDFLIERRQPVTAELDEQAVWVIDIGERFEPEKHNFDHHQSLDCPASFVLLADYLGLQDTLSILPWWQFKDSVDRFGPIKAAERFNAGDDLVNRNPMEDWILARFASEPQAILPLLKSFGHNVIDYAHRLKRQIHIWQSSRRLIIAGVQASICETTESFGLDEFRRLESAPPDIIISLDSRSQGWRLFRYEGTRVDFSRIARHPDIAFAHKTGFLAKTTTRLPIDQLTALVSMAVIKS
jgi:hypothetical protein